MEKLQVKELDPDQHDVAIKQPASEKGKRYVRDLSPNWYTRKVWLAGCSHANAVCFLKRVRESFLFKIQYYYH